jgi:ligand-binding SRPBCC domain-containing protein
MPDFSVFQRSVLLDAPVTEVYAFHENPRNITKISPASLRINSIECSVPAHAGDEFRLSVSQFGIALEWVGVWEAAVPGSHLVDGARKSPFRHWRHHHLFQAEGNKTIMTDRVEYALPGGVLGLLLDLTMMPIVFFLMFIARHRATKAFFAKTAH